MTISSEISFKFGRDYSHYNSSVLARKMTIDENMNFTSSYISNLNGAELNPMDIKSEYYEDTYLNQHQFHVISAGSNPFQNTGNYIDTIFSASINFDNYVDIFDDIQISAHIRCYLFENDLIFLIFKKSNQYQEGGSSDYLIGYKEEWYRVPVVFDTSSTTTPPPTETEKIKTDCCLKVLCYPDLYELN